ncbi:MAG: lipocalin family protein [Christiangramia sp.]
MKKILILLLSMSLLTSCSDDDSNSSDGTQIVGKWYLESVRSVGGDNLLNECNQDSFIQFNTDGTANSEFYGDSSGECEIESDDSGDWKFEGGNNYTFYVPYFEEDTTGSVNFTSDNQFIFTSPDLPGVEIVFEK